MVTCRAGVNIASHPPLLELREWTSTAMSIENGIGSATRSHSILTVRETMIRFPVGVRRSMGSSSERLVSKVVRASIGRDSCLADKTLELRTRIDDDL